MAMSKLDRNNVVLNALGHPLRRKILRHLEGNPNGGLSPKQLAEIFEQPIGVVSYHIRLLAEAGILKLTNTKQRRGAVEHFYLRSGTAADQRATDVLKLIGKD